MFAGEGEWCSENRSQQKRSLQGRERERENERQDPRRQHSAHSTQRNECLSTTGNEAAAVFSKGSTKTKKKEDRRRQGLKEADSDFRLEMISSRSTLVLLLFP